VLEVNAQEGNGPCGTGAATRLKDPWNKNLERKTEKANNSLEGGEPCEGVLEKGKKKKKGDDWDKK